MNDTIEDFKQMLEGSNLDHLWRQVAMFHAGREFHNLRRKLIAHANKKA